VLVCTRQCKHLRELRGDEAEDARLAAFDADDRPGHAPRAARVGARGVLLAQKWDAKVDPTGWWMSEKLDGVR
jgi:DNA ligase-1